MMSKIPKYNYKHKRHGLSTEERTGKFRQRVEGKVLPKRIEILLDEEIEEYLNELDSDNRKRE